MYGLASAYQQVAAILDGITWLSNDLILWVKGGI